MIRAVRRRELLSLVLVALAGGCDFLNPNELKDPGPITVSWKLGLEGGGAVTCDGVGASRVQLIADSAKPSFEMPIDVACTAAEGELRPLEDGDHVVKARLLNEQGATLVRAAPTNLKVERGRRQKVQIQFVVRPRAVVLDWTLSSSLGRRSCDQAGATSVELSLRSQAGIVPRVERFPCAEGTAIGSSLQAGTYAASARLVGIDGLHVSGVDIGPFSVEGTRPVDVGAILFRVAMVRLNWRIQQISTGMTAACADVGAETVEIQATRLGDAPPRKFSFRCAEERSESPALPIGTYKLEARLGAADGRLLATATASADLRAAGALGPDLVFALP